MPRIARGPTCRYVCGGRVFDCGGCVVGGSWERHGRVTGVYPVSNDDSLCLPRLPAGRPEPGERLPDSAAPERPGDLQDRSQVPAAARPPAAGRHQGQVRRRNIGSLLEEPRAGDVGQDERAGRRRTLLQ